MANALLVVLPKLGLLFLFTFLLCNVIKPTTKSVALAFNGKRLSMRLIHYNSLVPHPTESDYAALAIRSSARHAYLKSKAKGFLVQNENVRAGILPGEGRNIFFVNITIGTPPVPQLAILDTGSTLFWIQCEPCKDCKQTPNPIYDPSKSSSYRTSSCYQSYCNSIIGGTCAENGECAYEVRYGQGGTSSSGVLGYESVTFETSFDEGIVVVPSVVFGCGRDNYEANPIPQSSGIFGLSPDDSSIMRSAGFRTSPRYSYCLGDVNDPSYTYGMLFLGNDSILQGQETPFLVHNGLVYVSLEGIKVGDTEIHINKEEYKFNVMIDTGTTVSYFHGSTCNLIKREVQKILGVSFESFEWSGLPCFPGDFRRDLRDFPIVTFRLANETLIELDVGSLFVQERDYFCLAVGTDDRLPVIGTLAQQYYNVGVDIDANKVYIQSMDCRFIDS